MTPSKHTLIVGSHSSQEFPLCFRYLALLSRRAGCRRCRCPRQCKETAAAAAAATFIKREEGRGRRDATTAATLNLVASLASSTSFLSSFYLSQSHSLLWLCSRFLLPRRRRRLISSFLNLQILFPRSQVPTKGLSSLGFRELSIVLP